MIVGQIDSPLPRGTSPEVVLVCSLVALTLVGAVVLRTACWLHNVLVARKNADRMVPEQTFGRAAFVMLVVSLMGGGTALAIRLYVVAGVAPFALLFLACPVTILALFITFAVRFRTTLYSALSVTLLFLLVTAVMGTVVVGAMWLTHALVR